MASRHPRDVGQASARAGVFVVSRVRLLRESLADIFRTTPGYELTGTSSGDLADIAVVLESGSDILLLDSGTPNSVTFVTALESGGSSVRVVVLAVGEHSPTILALVEAGTFAFIARDGTREDVLATVAAAMRDEALCPPAIVAILVSRVQALAGLDVARPIDILTFRERQILNLVADGASNKQISRDLCIQLSTVKNHVHNILEKLKVPDRRAAAARVQVLEDPVAAQSVSSEV
jgi:DNA-binding NarL/FixJ family response regulator